RQYHTRCFATIKDETGTLNNSTTIAKSKFHHVSIQYCTKCRWMLKSFWFAQELLSTFGKDDLDAVTIVPSFDDTKGNFAIRLSEIDVGTASPDDDDKYSTSDQLLWDRKEQGGFPPTKDLKQLLRDSVNPERYLGHSDTEARKTEHDSGIVEGDSETASNTPAPETAITTVQVPLNQDYITPGPSVVIHYCTGCQWMLRAAYLGQELLTTFDGGELKSVTLVPSKPPEKGGRFANQRSNPLHLAVVAFVSSKSVLLDGNELFDRKTEGRFPEPKEIKQLIRDKVAPSKDLGHSDVDGRKSQGSASGEADDDDMDDEEAEDARRYFGVM
ncbi:MAG: hypothetical protein SGILL_007105, partial [Bacillariaceae sp.]